MKINAKCMKCGADDWKHVGPTVKCAVCDPRHSGQGKKPWPRHISVTQSGGKRSRMALHLWDGIGLKGKLGWPVTVHKEPWGYRVVLDKKKGRGRR